MQGLYLFEVVRFETGSVSMSNGGPTILGLRGLT